MLPRQDPLSLSGVPFEKWFSCKAGPSCYVNVHVRRILVYQSSSRTEEKKGRRRGWDIAFTPRWYGSQLFLDSFVCCSLILVLSFSFLVTLKFPLLLVGMTMVGCGYVCISATHYFWWACGRVRKLYKVLCTLLLDCTKCRGIRKTARDDDRS